MTLRRPKDIHSPGILHTEITGEGGILLETINAEIVEQALLHQTQLPEVVNDCLRFGHKILTQDLRGMIKKINISERNNQAAFSHLHITGIFAGGEMPPSILQSVLLHQAIGYFNVIGIVRVVKGIASVSLIPHRSPEYVLLDHIPEGVDRLLQSRLGEDRDVSG